MQSRENIGAAGGLAACAGPQVSDYAAEKPVLDLATYFNGTLDAYGVFTDRSGKVVRRFTVAEGLSVKQVDALIRAEPCQSATIEPHHGPFVHRFGTERLVEFDSRRVPVQNRPFEPATVFHLCNFKLKKPLRFFGMVGATTFVVGAVLITWLVFERLVFGYGLTETAPVARWTASRNRNGVS